MEAIWTALKDGAPFSFINMAVAAFAVAIIGERAYHVLTRYKVNAEEFMNQVAKLVQAGNVDRAVRLTQAGNMPLLQVVRAGLTQVNRGEEAIMASIEEQMAEAIPQLEKRIAWLWSLANIATLIGLLGTIKGLITAFNAVAKLNDPALKTTKLMEGIGEAMWNTAFGLGIAVSCMIAHLFLHSMAKKHRESIERAAMRLENLLTIRRQG